MGVEIDSDSHVHVHTSDLETRGSSSCAGRELNQRLYGKCPDDQQHNYVMEVTLRGPVSERTGVVMVAEQFRALVDAAVSKVLDQATESSEDVRCSSESVCVAFWHGLRSLLPDPGILHEVKVYGADTVAVSYRGETTYL
ncbi:6-pyruvoyl tetrahydrobiopterin synthase-like [Bacillus rossius redtenbacheri]|uniref:6-pyruvoyl tetrahydrobiopterin synthase-like n=1 Tax=Bacillus rossius redtenbacheri TaxID=93214 RepID=UPI002FDDDE5E